MLVRLLRTFPGLPEAAQIRQALNANLAGENVLAEAAYFKQPNRQSFERTYGWAWLLKLAEELHSWDDVDGKRWGANLQPLVDVIVKAYADFLPKQTYPIRTGVHPNTAFGLAFALDYAQAVGDKKLETLLDERSRTYFARDASYPGAWEPGGEDFFSPALMEADLMRRVMKPAEFARWFHQFLPGISKSEPAALLRPAIVTDRSDPRNGDRPAHSCRQAIPPLLNEGPFTKSIRDAQECTSPLIACFDDCLTSWRRETADDQSQIHDSRSLP